MSTAFGLLCGISWTATYLLMIRVGLRERTYAIPLPAFTLNISWEFMFTFVRPYGDVQLYVNALWVSLNCVIGYTIVRHGPVEFPQLSRRLFYACLAVMFLVAYPVLYLFSVQFDPPGTGMYSANLLNLVMSGLFVGMLIGRRGSRGQSVAIAATKMVGTACSTLSNLTAADPPADQHGGLLPMLYIGCFLLDLLYLCALIVVRKRERRTTSDMVSEPAGTPWRTAANPQS